MPLTKSGKEVMSSMKKQYGKRGEEVFYKSVNKGVPGSEKWHGKSKKEMHRMVMKKRAHMKA